MKLKSLRITFIFSLALALVVSGCRREIINTDTTAKLRFSEDTVHFDTVFSTVGSVTLSLILFNDFNTTLEVSNITLAGGAFSQFRMNVDGAPGDVFDNIQIPPNDSLYVFVEVTVDPNEEALPYVIEDSILFSTNGNMQTVRLIAYGQNAHFHYGQILGLGPSDDTTWTDDLPHVIIGSVLVDSLFTLHITEGTNIYLHGGSYFYVLGTLDVQGTKDSVVTFQGDRLEDFYKDVPGQWEGIYFLRGSTNNVIKYAEIKNALEGISLGFSTVPDLSSFLDNQVDLTLENTMIYDIQNNGITSLNSVVKATNCLVYNIGASNVALFLGGDYQFRHCTLANYGSTYLSHQSPILGFTDYFEFNIDNILQNDLTKADFYNCIIYGSIAEGDEIVIDTLLAPTVFNFNFDHCIMRTTIDESLLNDTGCFYNQDPIFANIGERNYCPTTGSPALNAGIDLPWDPVLIDIRGEVRPFAGTLPDIGAYETTAE
ncbi:MAG TPA: choice-of-anchor Q domain-containing protein [Chitinophagales bacterium]|nr:choice-of-anchor Q domain-containing protein [Chitinophagales bacterium]